MEETEEEEGGGRAEAELTMGVMQSGRKGGGGGGRGGDYNSPPNFGGGTGNFITNKLISRHIFTADVSVEKEEDGGKLRTSWVRGGKKRNSLFSR